MDEHYKQWLNDLKVGDVVVVEQPSYQFIYYLTTIADVTSAGVRTKGFPSVLFTDGEYWIGKFEYLLLEPTDEILDEINLINNRRRLESTNWSGVDDDVVADVSDLVYGD